MREFVDGIKDKKPNDAHIALAEYGNECRWITSKGRYMGIYQQRNIVINYIIFQSYMEILPLTMRRLITLWIHCGKGIYTTISNALRVLAKSCGAI